MRLPDWTDFCPGCNSLRCTCEDWPDDPDPSPRLIFLQKAMNSVHELMKWSEISPEDTDSTIYSVLDEVMQKIEKEIAEEESK